MPAAMLPRFLPGFLDIFDDHVAGILEFDPGEEETHRTAA